MKETTEKPAKGGVISTKELLDDVDVPRSSIIRTKNGGIDCVLSVYNIT